ncbi:dihydroorotase family protein [Candidatus Bathyarchaeota archaeon]|nr:dihydroorotase family protein [Candidatus Bathyarchaeota archaeon]
MKVDLLLKDVKAFLKGDILECCIAIEGGKILQIGKEPNMPLADEIISLKGLLVLPGLIDVHVHLRDEGKSYKEDFHSGTAAAAAGGVTTVLDMPNNNPITMSAEALKRRMEKAKGKILVNVGFYSEFPEKLSEIDRIIREGVIGFKLFMGTKMGGLNIDDDSAIRKALARTASKVPIAVHAEDRKILEAAERRLKLQGRSDIEAFILAHPEEAEVKAVKRIISLAKDIGCRLHLCHLSTSESLKLVAEAKKVGKVVSCEVTPHHLFLSKDDLQHIGNFAVTVPPLRNKNHQEFLWKGLRTGIVDVIASDHAPHTLEEKESNIIWYVKAGIAGLETMLPLLLTEVNKGRLSIGELVKLTAVNPAKIFNIPDAGSISEGGRADLVAVNLKQEYRIDASKFKSKARFSPFDGWKVKGKPVKTFVAGKLIMDEDEIVAKAGSGKIIRARFSS